MKLNFTYEVNDAVAFQKHYMDQKKTIRNIRVLLIVVILLMLLITLLGNVIEKKPFEFPVSSVIISAVFILFACFFGKFNLWFYAKMMKKGNSQLFGEMIMTVDPEKIFIEGPVSATIYKWTSILKVEETKQYYFIYITSMTAIIISKSKLHDDGKFGNLLRENASIHQYSYFTI